MSVYFKDSIEDLLICKICQQKLTEYDEPKTLPCGFTICSECDSKIETEFINREKRIFKCLVQDCLSNEHVKPVDGFSVNQLALRLISVPHKKIYQGEKIEKLKLNLNKLERLLKVIDTNIEQSEFKINGYCNELRRKIQLASEVKIKKINDLNDLLISQVDLYEQECNNSFKTAKKYAVKNNLNEIKFFLDENLSFINNFEIESEDSISKTNEKCINFIFQLKNEKKFVKDLMFNQKQVKFEQNKTKLEENFLGHIKIEHLANGASSIIFSPPKDTEDHERQNHKVTDDKKIEIIDTEVKTLIGHIRSVCCLAVLQNQTIFASGSFDKTIRLWNFLNGQTIKILKGHDSIVVALTAIEEDSLLISGSYDKTIRVWNINSGQQVKILNGHTAGVCCLAILPDQARETLASGGEDKTIRIWNINTSQVLKILTGHSQLILSLAFLPDQTLASGSEDKTIRIWDVDSNQTLKILNGHHAAVSSLSVLDNKILASGSYDKTIKIWNTENGQVMKTLRGHKSLILSTAVLADGKLISSSDDKTIRIWSSNDHQTLKILKNHSVYISCVVGLPDGKICSCSGDKTIKIWDINSGIKRHSIDL